MRDLKKQKIFMSAVFFTFLVFFIFFIKYFPMIGNKTTINSIYTNPLTLPNEWLDYGAGDPFVLKFNGTYYLYVSTRDDQVGIKCWSSTDLIHWAYEGLCTNDPVTKGAYAPEVVYWNGTFYMYTSPLGQGHYVLTSSSPTGPFRRVTENLGYSIDGHVFIDDDGSWYFYHAGPNGIVGHIMTSPISIDSDGKVLSGTQISGQWTEAPTVIKRNGTYYLTASGNHVLSTGYRVNLFTNKSGPLANYNPSGNNPILLNTEGNHVGLGHNGIIIGPDLDTYYIIYHNLIGKSVNSWPIRAINIDAIGWNGDKMVIYGPTDWQMSAPSLPTFEDRFNRPSIGGNWFNVNGGHWGINDSHVMYQDAMGNSTFFMDIVRYPTGENYTAEYNVREVQRGTDERISRFGAVFGYQDSNNYGIAVLSSYYNRLETNFLVNGVWSSPEYTPLPEGFDYQKWHIIRIEKYGSTYKFFIDGMLKQVRSANLGGGKIGYLSCDNYSEFGYIAFSNKVNGSGIFDFYKPLPGTIEAVHYNNGGEGIGYHVTNIDDKHKNMYRNDDVKIEAHPNGGYCVSGNSGDWYKYNINVKKTGIYNVGIEYAKQKNVSVKIRIWFDSVDVTGVIEIPNGGSYNDWSIYVVKGLKLNAGKHTIKLEIVEGNIKFYTLTFYEADNSSFSITDNFENFFSDEWNWFGGMWTIEDGEAVVDNVGKITLGDVRWLDYSIEVDVKGIDAMNAGIIFRVINPAQGGAGDDADLGSDFLQGYYAGLTPDAVILGKHNYSWALLASSSGKYDTNKWYHMKVVVKGNNIKVYVDDMNNPKIDYTDNNSPFIHGKVGLRVHYARTHFDNFKVESVE